MAGSERRAGLAGDAGPSGSLRQRRCVEPLGSSRPFDPVVEERDSPANADGILAIDRPANPFRGWTVVYIPYCTGDVHLGARKVDYAGVAMDHCGAANAAAAVGSIPEGPGHRDRRWRRRIPSPDHSRHSGGWGVRQALSDVPVFAAIDSARLTFESLDITAGPKNPKLRLAQINQDHDAVQLQFLAMIGVTGTPLAPLLQANLDAIQAALPTFRRYLIPSEELTILTRPSFLHHGGRRGPAGGLDRGDDRRQALTGVGRYSQPRWHRPGPRPAPANGRKYHGYQ